MERLTKKAWRNLDPWECCGQDNYCQRGCHDEGGCNKGCIVPKIYDKLAKYEDAEEHGRLIVLPCKIGDILYAPTRNFVSEFRVTQFDFGGYNEPHLWAEWYLCNGITGNFRIDGIGASEIGKTVFLSREEAEKALEGMK